MAQRAASLFLRIIFFRYIERSNALRHLTRTGKWITVLIFAWLKQSFSLICFRYQPTWITPAYLTYQNVQPFPYCLIPFPFKHPIFFTKNTTFFLPSSSKYRALSNRWFKKTSLSSSEQWQAINSERSFDWRGHDNFRNVSGLRSPTSLNITSTGSGNFINSRLLLSCVMSWQR